MTVAGIDIGTNTILMVIADVHEDGSITVLEDHHRIPRLGEGVDASHMISEEATGRAAAVLREYRQILARHGHPPVVCVGTSALRDAHNQDDVLWELNEALEELVRVIDGETEARLTFLGTVGSSQEAATVCDIGGGSTELVSGAGGQIEQRVSLQIGCVRLAERWTLPGPVDEEHRRGLREDVRSAITASDFDVAQSGTRMIAVAGTPVALAMLDLGLNSVDPSLIEHHQLSTSTVARLRDRLLSLDQDSLQALPGIDPRRADILPAGAAILFETMNMLGFPEVEVSTHGLRFGAALAAAGIYT